MVWGYTEGPERAESRPRGFCFHHRSGENSFLWGSGGGGRGEAGGDCVESSRISICVSPVLRAAVLVSGLGVSSPLGVGWMKLGDPQGIFRVLPAQHPCCSHAPPNDPFSPVLCGRLDAAEKTTPYKC